MTLKVNLKDTLIATSLINTGVLESRVCELIREELQPRVSFSLLPRVCLRNSRKRRKLTKGSSCCLPSCRFIWRSSGCYQHRKGSFRHCTGPSWRYRFTKGQHLLCHRRFLGQHECCRHFRVKQYISSSFGTSHCSESKRLRCQCRLDRSHKRTSRTCLKDSCHCSCQQRRQRVLERPRLLVWWVRTLDLNVR